MIYGIARDSILRLDVDTKDVISRHPYPHLKRWAATDHTLTLDWGSHATEFTTVKTSDGRVIAELMSGYINIMLRKRGDHARTIPEKATIKQPPPLPPKRAITSTDGM